MSNDSHCCRLERERSLGIKSSQKRQGQGWASVVGTETNGDTKLPQAERRGEISCFPSPSNLLPHPLHCKSQFSTCHIHGIQSTVGYLEMNLRASRPRTGTDNYVQKQQVAYSVSWRTRTGGMNLSCLMSKTRHTFCFCSDFILQPPKANEVQIQVPGRLGYLFWGNTQRILYFFTIKNPTIVNNLLL